MHTCHLLGPPRSRLNVRDTLAQWSAGRDRITAKLECAAMIYRMVTWGEDWLGARIRSASAFACFQGRTRPLARSSWPRAMDCWMILFVLLRVSISGPGVFSKDGTGFFIGK